MKKKKGISAIGFEFKDGTIAYFTGSFKVLGYLADLVGMGLRPQRLQKPKKRKL